MKVDQAKRLKEVEVENARLKKLVADLCLDMAIFEEAAWDTFEVPSVAATAPSRSVSGHPSGRPVRCLASTDRSSANA